jgi:hypothetical protein
MAWMGEEATKIPEGLKAPLMLCPRHLPGRKWLQHCEIAEMRDTANSNLTMGRLDEDLDRLSHQK